MATTFSQLHQLSQLRTDFVLGTKWCFGGHCVLLLVFGTLTKVSICSARLSRQLWGCGVDVLGYWHPSASCWVDLQWYEMHVPHYLWRTGMSFLPLAVEVFFFCQLVELKFFFFVHNLSLVVVCSRIWPPGTCESHWELIHPSAGPDCPASTWLDLAVPSVASWTLACWWPVTQGSP